MTNSLADLREALDEAEDENDALSLRLAEIAHTVNGGELVPHAVVMRLSEGDNPLRVWREHRELSLRAVAETAGISPAMLSEMETGKKEGSIRTLRAIAEALSVDLDDLEPWPQ